jgi:hypothetical protein
MTKLLLLEVEQLMDEVSSFVRLCCNSQPADDDIINVIDISERLFCGVLATTNKLTRVRVNDLTVIPPVYKDTIFGPLHKKEIVSWQCLFLKSV